MPYNHVTLKCKIAGAKRFEEETYKYSASTATAICKEDISFSSRKCVSCIYVIIKLSTALTLSLSAHGNKKVLGSEQHFPLSYHKRELFNTSTRNLEAFLLKSSSFSLDLNFLWTISKHINIFTFIFKTEISFFWSLFFNLYFDTEQCL